MKRFFTFCIIAIFCFAFFVGCGSKDVSNEGTEQNQETNKAADNKEEKALNSLERVKEAGKIVIGIDDTYPPMEFRNEKNELVGFDIELAKEVTKKLGIEAEFVPNDWNGIFIALNSSKFDIIFSSVSITDERKKTMDFSEPYIFGGNAVAVKAENSTIKSLTDLKGKIVGVQLGTTAQEVVGKMDGLKEVKKYDKMTEAFIELTNERIDAVVTDPQVGGYYISKNPDKYVILDEMVNQEPIGIAFRKDEKELREAIQKALDDLKADGTMSKLSQKWFGYDAYKQ